MEDEGTRSSESKPWKEVEKCGSGCLVPMGNQVGNKIYKNNLANELYKGIIHEKGVLSSNKNNASHYQMFQTKRILKPSLQQPEIQDRT